MKIISVFAGLALALVLLIGLPAWYFGYFSPMGRTKVFVVEKGENFAQVAHRLQKENIIRSERALRWYLNLAGSRKKLQRGEFEVRENMPVPELVFALTEGKPIEYKFTVPEGYNVFQIAEQLQQKGLAAEEEFLAAVRSPELLAEIPTLSKSAKHPRSIEGYIYPDTYLLQKVYTAKEIAHMMLSRFREVYHGLEGEIEASAVTRKYNMSPHDVITLASIVEKETGAASERPLIASVFLNRMDKKMKLQTDPTVIYGVWSEKGFFDGDIHKRDLSTYTEYNTYMIPGLPPGPIASPGINAIRAVLHPSESDFLFFVSKNDGTHIFTKSFGEHQRAVVKTQLLPGVKEGKSWRELPKEKRAVN